MLLSVSDRTQLDVLQKPQSLHFPHYTAQVTCGRQGAITLEPSSCIDVLEMDIRTPIDIVTIIDGLQH
jgi:hypothetical protein